MMHPPQNFQAKTWALLASQRCFRRRVLAMNMHKTSRMLAAPNGGHFNRTFVADDRFRSREWLMAPIALMAGSLALITYEKARCEEHCDAMDDLPTFSAAEVSKHNGEDGGSIWMTYGGMVYDVSEFILNHPGGSEKIIMAAGTAIEPFWHLYRQHYASDLPMTLMESMVIGRLAEEDQERVDEIIVELEKKDPYSKEPPRDDTLTVHSDTPMNAECPVEALRSYITPIKQFYIRHHHPVPLLSDEDASSFRLQVDLTAYGKGKVEYSLAELQEMKPTEVTATLQCSGNRRSGYNSHQRTSGTPWGQGAISTARFKGVRLADLLRKAGVSDFIEAEEELGLEHVRMHSLDGMMASIGIEKAVNPYGDVIVCYEMNGERLPRDHGYPLRMIVPGYAAVRNVKWLRRIELAKTEAEGAWQRGLNYKTLPPNVTDAKTINLSEMPSMTEVSLFSGITAIEAPKGARSGETVTVQASGWAWAGGGRNIVRVDCTGDGGETWATAKLNDGTSQRFGRAWAWTFWTCNVECKVGADGKVSISSKAVDMAHNVQPEDPKHLWNVRGLGNNSWYTTQVQV